MGAAARREVELWGWSAATRVLREQQYARAVRIAHSKRRFWWLALRVRTARAVRSALGLLAAVWAAVISRLDYAAAYRTGGASGSGATA
jgi:hypothetical protein